MSVDRATLASEFTSIIRGWLRPGILLEIDRRNALEDDPSICHSHDFCDPNQAMIEALANFEEEFNPQDETQGALIQKAWDAAKLDGFTCFDAGGLFDELLPKLIFELVEFGLNADWSVPAYWIRDSGRIGRYDGTDLYLLDNEDGTMSLVTRKDSKTEGNDEVKTIKTDRITVKNCGHMAKTVALQMAGRK